MIARPLQPAGRRPQGTAVKDGILMLAIKKEACKSWSSSGSNKGSSTAVVMLEL
jgi:hypothetical protein